MSTTFEITFKRHLKLLNEKIQPVISESAPVENLSEAPIEVGEYGLQHLQDALAHLNKKANKWGLPPLSLTINSEKTVDAKNKEGEDLGYKVKRYTVSITGESPRVQGYEFVAKIEHADGGNIINVAPNARDKKLPSEFRTLNSSCDVCNSNRDRLNTFLLLNTKDGKYIQAGSTCLKRFLPPVSVNSLIQYAQIIDDLRNISQEPELRDDEYGGGGGGRFSKYLPISTMIQAVCATYLIEKKFVSKTKAHEWGTTSTGDIALNLLFSKNDDEMEIKFRNKYASEECAKLKNDVLEWAKKFDFDAKAAEKPELQSYFNNLSVLANSDDARIKNISYVAGLVGMYLREKEFLAAKKAADSKPSEFVGNVGEKIDIVAKIVKVHPYQSQYGTTYIYTMQDQTGNNFLWFSSNDLNLEIGTEYKIKATVKQHQLSKFNQQKETILTRGKVQTMDGNKVNEGK